MARGSSLSDDIDPAPRLLRILASSLIASGEPVGKVLAARLRRDADVLEGATMTAAEANRSHARMLARERRVRPVRSRAGAVVATKVPLAARSAEDERHVQQLRDAGLWDDDDCAPE